MKHIVRLQSDTEICVKDTNTEKKTESYIISQLRLYTHKIKKKKTIETETFA